jgi:CheY-like chemotaxis protein
MAPPRAAPVRVPLILVVDDTPSLLDLVRTCLEEEGYRVVTCLRSRDALRLAHEERPDAILLDLVMPEMSGWEVLEHLRADTAFVRTPVIVCTAYVAEALGRLPDLRGPTGDARIGLLPKPFDTEELVEVVAAATGTTWASQ